jgi:hypothetical protein
VSSSNNSDKIFGSFSPALTGTMYFPGDALTITGGSGIDVGANVPAIIADTITLNGGSYNIQSGSGSGSYKIAALVQ